MKTTLLLFILSNSICFGQYIRDMLHDTEVSYHNFDTTLNSSTFRANSIPAKIVTIHQHQSIAANQLNNNIIKGVDDLTNSKNIYAEFQHYFVASNEYNIRREYTINEEEKTILHAWLNDFDHDVKRIEVDVYALSAQILVLSFGVHYDAYYENDTSYYLIQEEQLFRTYRYYELRSGEEINRLTLISDEKRLDFETFIRQRLPKSFEKTISDKDIRNGLPIFHGTGFYYLVKGHGELSEYFLSGIPNVGIRLELEEVKPFMNKDGVFKDYATISPSKPDIHGFLSHSYSINSPCGEEQSYKIRRIQDLTEHIPPKTGVKRSIAELQQHDMTGFSYLETNYLRSGQPIYQVSYYNRDNKTVPKDSTTYHYKKGVLRRVDNYERNYRSEKLEWKSSYYFDELSNIERIYEYEDRSPNTESGQPIMYVSEYIYFGDFVIIQEYLESDQGQFFIPDIVQYFFDDCLSNKLTDYRKSHYPLNRYQISETKDSIVFYFHRNNEKKILWYGIKKNGLVVQKTILDNGTIGLNKRFNYNENGLPIRYETTSLNRITNEFDVQIIASAQYSKLGLPQRLIIESRNRQPQLREYTIRYFK
jgi:hypothetical protein